MTENNNFIYRFRTINEYTIQSLKYSQIFLSPMEALNDPMEGISHFFFKADKEEWKDFLYLYLISFRLFFDVRLKLDMEDTTLEEEGNVIFHLIEYMLSDNTKDRKEFFDNPKEPKKDLDAFCEKMIKDEAIQNIYEDLSVCKKLSHIELMYLLNRLFIWH